MFSYFVNFIISILSAMTYVQTKILLKINSELISDDP